MNATHDILTADERVVWTRDFLRFGDTDANGHINNATYAVLFESGRVGFHLARMAPLLPEGCQLVIAKLVIEFKAELFYPGAVATATWATRVGRTSITLAQALFAAENAAPAAVAEGVCVVIDARTRRPAPFSDAARDRLAALVRPD